MTPPGITAVVPLYDKAAHVEAALLSIAAQTLPPAATIVVDDGSTDGGDRIVERLALPGLRLIRQRNAGPGAARNAGIAAAQTPFVAFLDADDLWRPDHLARLSELASANRGLALYANRFAPLGAEPGPEPPDRIVADYAAEWLDGLIVHTIATMADREAALSAGGFSTTANRGEDLALWLKLTRGGAAMALGGYCGGLYRQEASDLTRRPIPGPDAAMQWIAAHLGRDDVPPAERATLEAYGARLAMLHAAEWIRFGGRDEARRFLSLAEGTPDRRRLRALKLLAGPLWPLRKALIGLRRRF